MSVSTQHPSDVYEANCQIEFCRPNFYPKKKGKEGGGAKHHVDYSEVSSGEQHYVNGEDNRRYPCFKCARHEPEC